MDSAKPTTMSRASSPARAPALFGKRGNHVAERRTIRCRHRARLEYPPPRKRPRQRGFSPYRAARPSAHGGLRRHFATRYGAPAASSVGQNGSPDLEIATGGDDPAGRARSRSVLSATASRVLSQARTGSRRRDPAVGIAGQRLAHQVRAKQRTRFTFTAALSER